MSEACYTVLEADHKEWLDEAALTWARGVCSGETWDAFEACGVQ